MDADKDEYKNLKIQLDLQKDLPLFCKYYKSLRSMNTSILKNYTNNKKYMQHYS